MDSVPVIDLERFFGGGSARLRAVEEINLALEELGFLVVTGHGAAPAALDVAVAAARRFFDLPLAEKMQLANAGRGYAPIGTTALSYLAGRASPPDLKESFSIGPAWAGDNLWPARPPDLRQALLDGYAALDCALARMLHVFAGVLGLPLDFFDEKFRGHDNSLRIFNYPLMSTALPGQLRAGEHTDFTAFTLLMVEGGAGGLQVRLKGGDWIDVAPPPGALVVNVGDLMMRWTNDRWLSNLHRVVNPLDEAPPRSRLSLVFFVNPRDDVTVECIETCCGPGKPAKYTPVSSGDFQAEKLRQFRRSVAAARADTPFGTE
jgi:isopenicillin N synthase-like dioxygenase